jgi:hypothetical protein
VIGTRVGVEIKKEKFVVYRPLNGVFKSSFSSVETYSIFQRHSHVPFTRVRVYGIAAFFSRILTGYERVR